MTCHHHLPPGSTDSHGPPQPDRRDEITGSTFHAKPLATSAARAHDRPMAKPAPQRAGRREAVLVQAGAERAHRRDQGVRGVAPAPKCHLPGRRDIPAADRPEFNKGENPHALRRSSRTPPRTRGAVGTTSSMPSRMWCLTLATNAIVVVDGIPRPGRRRATPRRAAWSTTKCSRTSGRPTTRTCHFYRRCVGVPVRVR
jgi:hypothetical protein